MRVLATEVVRGREGDAVVVHLRDASAKPIVAAPIAIEVRDAAGRVVYENNAPGESPSLTKVSLQPGREAVWIDDQVRGGAAPRSATAKVGEGERPAGAAPRLSVAGLRLGGEGAEAQAEGEVENRSSTKQLELVVFVLAVKGGRTVAAGRAVLPEVLPGASDSFQVYLVGDPSGAQLRASVPPTSY